MYKRHQCNIKTIKEFFFSKEETCRMKFEKKKTETILIYSFIYILFI